MKLRTNKNSLRLRLSQKEVEAFNLIGSIEEQLNFSKITTDCLRYSLIQADHENISVTYNNNHIRVYLPTEIALKWCTSDQVGIEVKLPLNDNENLFILLEKDYQCLVERPNEDESNNFPNPNVAKC